MLKRSVPVIRIVCLLLGGVLLYQLGSLALHRDPLAGVRVPAALTAAKAPAGMIAVQISDGGALEDVLFEQLEYLLQFAEQEGDRLERVKAILMEPFH